MVLVNNNNTDNNDSHIAMAVLSVQSPSVCFLPPLLFVVSFSLLS